MDRDFLVLIISLDDSADHVSESGGEGQGSKDLWMFEIDETKFHWNLFKNSMFMSFMIIFPIKQYGYEKKSDDMMLLICLEMPVYQT